MEASENMELYDIETDSEVYKQGVYLTDAVTENTSPESMVNAVHEVTKKYIKRNKFVTVLVANILYLLEQLEHLMRCFLT